MPYAGDRTFSRSKILSLLGSVWLVLGVFSYGFSKTVFGLTPEQENMLHWWPVLVLLALFAIASGFVVLGLVRPLEMFSVALSTGEEIPEAVLDRAARATPSLYFRLALVGFVSPLLWMLFTGLVVAWASGGSLGHLSQFLILGLFDAMLMTALLFFVPQLKLNPIIERLSVHRAELMSGRGISLRGKVLINSLLLAGVPTLLVGWMSINTANRLLDEEAGQGLQEKLARVSDETGALLRNGVGRLEVEGHLTLAAQAIADDCFIHLSSGSKDFFRSERANPLSPRLVRRILERFDLSAASDGILAGNILDDESGRAFTYVFTQNGKMLAIAPVRHARSQTTSTLYWLIIGMMVCSMTVALMVGILFAGNLGSKIQRLLGLTEEIARGDLTRDIRVFSDDEIGKLGGGMVTMSENLRRMVRDMNALAGQISTTCNQLLIKASAISTGAEIQASSVSDTSSAVEELDSNIQAASENLQVLAESTQEAAVAANKVGESFNLALTEASGMQQTVERTGLIVSKMVGSVSDVAGSIQDLSDGAGRSAMSMREMDRSISMVTTSASDTARIARKAIEAAQVGAVAVRRSIEGMDRIVASTQRASDVIMGLSNRVEDIGSILGVIEEIADQTNLLALNAAIIAAQAGEHGRSFAVVADEIRSLAERTTSSTREISQMINDIQETSQEASSVMQGGVGTVAEGVSLVKQADESLNLILISVQKAAVNVEEIAVNTEGQAKASELVTREIARVAEMAERITKAAAGQANSGEKLQQAFLETLSTSESLGAQINQQAQENRQAMAAVAASNESATRANKAMLGQSSISEGILQAIEQVREIAKNHAIAASEMGDATKTLAEKSARLKDEIDEFKV